MAEESSNGEIERLKTEVAALREALEDHLDHHHLPGEAPSLPPGFKISSQRYRKAESRRRELLDVLIACGWNKTETARKLGISRVSVWRRMKQLGLPLEPPEAPESEAPPSPETTSSEDAQPPAPSKSLDLSWD